MAENKKSFVAYTDWGEVFDNLEDDQAGKLVKHLFNYVRDLDPKADKLTELLFISIKLAPLVSNKPEISKSNAKTNKA